MVQLITSAVPPPFPVAVAFVEAVPPPSASVSRDGNSMWPGSGGPRPTPDPGNQQEEVVGRVILV